MPPFLDNKFANKEPMNFSETGSALANVELWVQQQNASLQEGPFSPSFGPSNNNKQSRSNRNNNNRWLPSPNSRMPNNPPIDFPSEHPMHMPPGYMPDPQMPPGRGGLMPASIDENLTPEQLQRREEQLAQLQKIKNMLFPEKRNEFGPRPHPGMYPPRPEGMMGMIRFPPGHPNNMMPMMDHEVEMDPNFFPNNAPLPPGLPPNWENMSNEEREWFKLQHEYYMERQKHHMHMRNNPGPYFGDPRMPAPHSPVSPSFALNRDPGFFFQGPPPPPGMNFSQNGPHPPDFHPDMMQGPDGMFFGPNGPMPPRMHHDPMPFGGPRFGNMCKPKRRRNNGADKNEDIYRHLQPAPPPEQFCSLNLIEGQEVTITRQLNLAYQDPNDPNSPSQQNFNNNNNSNNSIQQQQKKRKKSDTNAQDDKNNNNDKSFEFNNKLPKQPQQQKTQEKQELDTQSPGNFQNNNNFPKPSPKDAENRLDSEAIFRNDNDSLQHIQQNNNPDEKPQLNSPPSDNDNLLSTLKTPEKQELPSECSPSQNFNNNNNNNMGFTKGNVSVMNNITSPTLASLAKGVESLSGRIEQDMLQGGLFRTVQMPENETEYPDDQNKMRNNDNNNNNNNNSNNNNSNVNNSNNNNGNTNGEKGPGSQEVRGYDSKGEKKSPFDLKSNMMSPRMHAMIGNANVQIEASAPNTIQYMPARPPADDNMPPPYNPPDYPPMMEGNHMFDNNFMVPNNFEGPPMPNDLPPGYGPMPPRGFNNMPPFNNPQNGPIGFDPQGGPIFEGSLPPGMPGPMMPGYNGPPPFPGQHPFPNGHQGHMHPGMMPFDCGPMGEFEGHMPQMPLYGNFGPRGGPMMSGGFHPGGSMPMNHPEMFAHRMPMMETKMTENVRGKEGGKKEKERKKRSESKKGSRGEKNMRPGSAVMMGMGDMRPGEMMLPPHHEMMMAQEMMPRVPRMMDDAVMCRNGPMNTMMDMSNGNEIFPMMMEGDQFNNGPPFDAMRSQSNFNGGGIISNDQPLGR